MSKGLEAYKLFLDDVEQCVQSGGIHYIDRKNRDIIVKELKALEILRAFDFEIEDYTEELNGSVVAKFKRIILDSEEIDLLKEVL